MFMKSIWILVILFCLSLKIIGQAPFPFFDNFESGTINYNHWSPFPSMQGVDGVVEIQDGVGVENTKGLKMGKSKDNTGLTTNTFDLSLNLLNQTNVEMTFWITDRGDETHDKDGIYFSDNGGDYFTKVVDFFPEEWCNNRISQHPPLDIDKLAAKAGLNLTDQFIIRFQQHGEDDFSGVAATDIDGFYIDEVKVYDPGLIYSTIPFEDDFDNGLFKNSWAWNFADETSTINTNTSITSPVSVVEVQNGVGVENSYGVILGRECDNIFTTNALDLHLNLAGESNVEMTFWIGDRGDETDGDDGIYFSDNGGISFVKVVNFYPSEWCNSTYGQHPPLDVDKLASTYGLSLTAQFVVRFQQHGADDFSGVAATDIDGFYLDEVKVYDPELMYSSIPFEDDFDNGLFKDSWAWNFADETSTINTNTSITSPISIVEIQNGVGVENSYGVVLGRKCDNIFTTNALDLHLNLAGETNVEMTFWIGDRGDETDENDGIYFSDNGGSSFVKVVDFYPSEWCNSIYGQHPPLDVDKLASIFGLSLTAQFVVRFQQHGADDFSGVAATDIDGFYLDEVKVYDPGLTFSSIPFEDDFDNGLFKESWAWNFADQTSTINSNTGITSPMSTIEIGNGVGVDNSYGVRVGRRCDNVFSTNALDLHLNLEEETNVNLTFWLADRGDETDADDGLYFSNDGGDTFIKVYDFNFSAAANYVYQAYQLDVSFYADSINLDLTDEFVIRFQQHGEDDFSGVAATDIDGFYLDDVSVTNIISSTSQLLEENIFEFFPNPATDIVTIQYAKGGIGSATVIVADLFGKSMLELNTDFSKESDLIDLSSCPTGIYFITVILENGLTETQKVMKR